MKFGSTAAKISLTSSNEEAIAILGNTNLDAVDFWLYLCSLDTSCPLWQDDWKQWVAGIREHIRKAGLLVEQCHALFNIFIPSDFHYEAPAEIIYRNMEACAMLDCHRLVFHPVVLTERVTDPKKRKRILDYNVWWFAQILPAAERLGIEIHIENVFDWGRFQEDGDLPFVCTLAEDICYVIDQLQHPLMKACFDSGHANISGQDIPAFIRRLGSRLGSLHLNDNFGRQKTVCDPHLLPGRGQIDWDGVFQALKDVSFDGTVNMEPVDDLPKLPPRQVAQKLSETVDFLKGLAEKYCL